MAWWDARYKQREREILRYGAAGYGNRLENTGITAQINARLGNVVTTKTDNVSTLQAAGVDTIPENLKPGMVLPSTAAQDRRQERQDGIGNPIAGPQGAASGAFGGRPVSGTAGQSSGGTLADLALSRIPGGATTAKQFREGISGISEAYKTFQTLDQRLNAGVEKVLPINKAGQALSGQIKKAGQALSGVLPVGQAASAAVGAVSGILPLQKAGAAAGAALEKVLPVSQARGAVDAYFGKDSGNNITSKTKLPSLSLPYDLDKAKAAGVIDNKTIKMQKDMDDSLQALLKLIEQYGDAAFSAMSPGQLQLLDSRGIKPIQVLAGSGGGVGSGGGGGYGSGGGRGAAASSPKSHFAGNSGYTGLINWRL